MVIDPTAVGPGASARQRWALVVIVFAVAVVARAGWAVCLQVRRGSEVTDQLQFPDEREYWALAESWRDGGGLTLPDGDVAKRMPLYPVLLSAWVRLSAPVLAARLMQAVFGGLAAVAMGLLGLRLGGLWVGGVAGLLVGLDVFGVFFASLILTEAPCVAAVCWFVLAGWPMASAGEPMPAWRVAGAAVLGVACVYLRPEAIAFVGLWAIVALWRRGMAWPVRLQVCVVVLVTVVALWPWAARNDRVLGRWVWLTTNGGASLYDGVGPMATGGSDLSEGLALPGMAAMAELDRDAFFRDRAFAAMRADPIRVARLAVVKFFRTWNIFPNYAVYRGWVLRLVSAAWMVPVLLAAAVGLWRLRGQGRAIVLLLLPGVYWTAVHCVFVGSMRYRQVAMPTIEVLAAVGVVGVLWWLSGRRNVGASGGR